MKDWKAIRIVYVYACIYFTNINASESDATCNLQDLKCTMISGNDMKKSSKISSIMLTYFSAKLDFYKGNGSTVSVKRRKCVW